VACGIVAGRRGFSTKIDAAMREIGWHRLSITSVLVSA
jgi:hypothetical protein